MTQFVQIFHSGDFVAVEDEGLELLHIIQVLNFQNRIGRKDEALEFFEVQQTLQNGDLIPLEIQELQGR